MEVNAIVASVYVFLFTFLVKSIFEVVALLRVKNGKNGKNGCSDCRLIIVELEYIKNLLKEIKEEVRRGGI